jgi:hypothetical protein
MVVDDQRFGRKEPNMIIIGVDYHPSDQYIAFVDTETGEGDERRLSTVVSSPHRNALPLALLPPARNAAENCLAW